MTIFIIGGALLIAAIFATRDDTRQPIIRRRRGLELKARKGRLIHVRETESEHEL